MNIYIKDDIYKIISEIKKFTPKGKPIIIHESASYIGFIKEPRSSKKKLELWLNILEEELYEYPWAIATFNYDFPKTKTFKRDENLSQLGGLSKLICKKYPENRTLDPIFSYVLRGDMDYWHNLDLLSDKPILHPFRKNSFYDTISGKNATFVALGITPDYDVTWYRFTPLHYIEEQMNVGYRYTKAFTGKIEEQDSTYEFRVRPTFLHPVIYKNNLEPFATHIKVGTDPQDCNQISLFKLDDLFKYLAKILTTNEFSLFADETLQEVKDAQKIHKYPFVE